MTIPSAEQFLGYLVGSAVLLTALVLTTAALTALFRPRDAQAALVCWVSSIAGLAAIPAHWLIDPLFSWVWPSFSTPVPPFSGLVVGAMDTVNAGVSGTWWPALVIAVYTLGVVYRLCGVAVGIVALRRIKARATALDIPDEIQDLPRLVGNGRPITWLLSPEIDGPATFGIRRPVVLFPPSTLDDAVALRYSACHELWHARRGDWGPALVAELIRAAFWYHPAAWWWLDRYELLRERVVDEEVVRTLGDRRTYADAIVATASASVDLMPNAALPWARKRHLQDRVFALLNPSTRWINPGAEQMKGMLVFTILCQLATSSLLAFPGTPRALGQSDTVYAIGGDVSAPKVTRQTKPEYTKEAMAQGITGEVVVSTIVRSDGTVGDAAVTKSLDDRYGLDEQAVAAVKQWVFSPAMRQGKPVAVRVEISLKFMLK